MGDKFCHLHCHTSFSLLDGIASPSQLVDKAAELGFSAIATTDHGNFNAGIRLYKAAKEKGLKPIVGVEAYFTDDTSIKKGSKNYHLTLWAKSQAGIKSLFKLFTKAHDPDVFYYKPRIDFDMLEDTEDLIYGTACAFGVLNHPNYARVIKRLYEQFGDDLYLEIMPLDFEQQYIANARARQLSSEFGIKMIATGDVHYLNSEDERLHNFLLSLHTDGNLQFDVKGLYLKTYQEMAKSFEEMAIGASIYEEALANTLEVADKCNIEWPESDIVLPHLVDGNPLDELKKRLKKNIKRLPHKGLKQYQNRLDYECGIIEQKKFVEYFLLVHDIVEMAKQKKIPFGPGRGSAAGSLVCYNLGITDLDPIKEDLSFERFLNPERSDYPDIDLDFSQRRRHEIIRGLEERFGKERVSYISTVSQLKLKSAFKDVARKLKVPFIKANQISEMLDDTLTMAENAENHPEFEEMIDPVSIDDLVYYTDGMINTLRHEGVHAAGIVIAPTKIENYGVLEKRKDGRCINWSMDDVAYQGLCKIDILGLRTLDIIDDAVTAVTKNKKGIVDWGKIDLNIPSLLAEFELGNTIGIFQFEKYSTCTLVQQLSPINDKKTLVDCNALVRPGPLESGMTETYIDRHTGRKLEFSEPYDDYLLPGGPGEDIAADTYQVPIYQEQVTGILQKIAGYTIPQADVVRRVIAKKKGDMETFRQEFIDGAYKTCGMSDDTANRLWNNLETFSRYGFNKSHAAAYTELALRQMYLKILYPLEYMTALFRCTTEEAKKIKFVDECQRLGIKLLPPDINLSEDDFTIEGDAIRIGLSAIKGIGEKALSHIKKQRKINTFSDVMGFRLRIPKAQVDSTALKHLIWAGAFESLGVNGKLWAGDLIDRITENGTLKGLEDGMPDVDDYTDEEKEMQKAALIPGIWKMQINPEVGLHIVPDILEEMREAIAGCDECPLRAVYDCPVPFEYTEKSEIMVIAEAPGETEVRMGRPLVGDAGDELIVKQLRRLGIKRNQLYLTNTYKCRPLENKIPDNISHECWEYLKMEIELLQPKIIFAMGNKAREFFTGQKGGIQAAADRLRPEVEIVEGRPIPVLYSVHPSSVFFKNGEANRERLRKSCEVLVKISKREWGDEDER